jgi:hypothetical protein
LRFSYANNLANIEEALKRLRVYLARHHSDKAPVG